MSDRMSGKMVLEKLGLEARFHPEREECVRLSRAWMTANGGFGGIVSERKLNAWNFGDLGSAMYPDAPLQQAALCAHLTNWIAVVDDTVESAPDRVGELRAALLDQGKGGHRSHAALVDAWNDIAHMLSKGALPSFSLRIRAALAGLFDAYAWEAHYRREQQVPSLAEFLRYRPDTAGMPIYLLILERAGGDPVEDGALTAPWFGPLNQLVGNLACWANDLLSFEWDRDIGNPISLVRVLTRGSERPALDIAWQHFYDTWAELLRTRAEAMAEAPTRARVYLERFPEIVTGVFTWMDLTQRYSSMAVSTYG